MENISVDTNNLRQLLRNSLQVTNVYVTFLKKDNTERIMQCTTDFAVIPKESQPAAIEGSIVVDPNYELFKVFDLEKNAWRSFNFEQVISWFVKGSESKE